MGDAIFTELSLVVIVTTALAFLFKWIRQPLIIAYLAAGIVLSPYGLNVITAHDTLGAFSKFGIAFLLFMVGLNLSPQIIREVGKISLITGLGQIVFTSTFGFLIAWAFGFSTVESMYIATALTFSSTIVIMKLLSDKKDLDSLYGRISVGFLIVQDVVAMLILMGVSTLAGGANVGEALFKALVEGAALMVGILWLGHFLLPPLTRKIADQQEFLILFCIAWCFALASLFHWFGFSLEIGALLAGISLSSSAYRYEITARMKPLRDFFILMFFVFLGGQMEFGNFKEHLLPVAIFSLFILIGNPLIVMGLMGALGYTKRTGFLAGLTVAQISEFSLILVAMGVTLGHLSPDILSFVTVVGLITIAGSTYFIQYGKKLYQFLAPYLGVFERKNRKQGEQAYTTHRHYDVLMLGYNHVGTELCKTFRAMKKKFLVVDHDPEVIARLSRQKVQCRYGDVEDDDVFEGIELRKISLVVSTIKDFTVNRAVLRRLLKENPHCLVMVVSERIEEALELYEEGASYVIMPHMLGGYHTSTILQTYGFDASKLMVQRVRHLKDLRT